MKIFILICLLFVDLNFSLAAERNIVLVILDGFRHDYLTNELTPYLMKFSHAGVISKKVVPVFPTVFMPNFISLLSGCYPENHGILANEFINSATREKFTSSKGASTENSYWYNMPLIWETARKNNVSTSSIMLPAVNFNQKYMNPDYSILRSDNLTIASRVSESIELLRKIDTAKSNLIALYFGDIDEESHSHGPESDEVKTAVREIDSALGMLADSISNNQLANNTDFIFLSMYGLANVIKFQTININQAEDSSDLEIINAGAFAYVYGNETKLIKFKNLIDSNFNLVTTYLQKDIPDDLKIKNSVCSPGMLILANYGWLLSMGNQVQNSDIKGVHGYDASHSEMNGLFIAFGPSFKTNIEVPDLSIIDIYPLICTLLGIVPGNSIDGKIENIRNIIK